MTHCIIIRGPLGVGKTTISKKLAEELDALYVSIDEVLSKYGLDQTDERCIPARNFIKGNEIALPEIKEALTKDKSVIIDGCFYQQEQIKHFEEKLPVAPLVFTLKAPVEVCIERDHHREKPYGEGATQAVHSLVSEYDYGMVIDTTNKTAEETLEEITSHLPNHER